MIKDPKISVIIPYGYHTPDLQAALQSTVADNEQTEVIIITNRNLKKELIGKHFNQYTIVVSDEKGRGYFCSTGVQMAKGSILLFLHADTTLPKQWFQKVMDVMSDSAVAGGGFSTHFRSNHWFLRLIPKLYNFFSVTIREFWGDRALFLRKKDLLPYLEKIEIPIMEDVEMSKIIRRHGKMVLLSDVVTTSEMHFSVKGYFRHTLEIILFRCLYASGIPAERIYKWYYRGSRG